MNVYVMSRQNAIRYCHQKHDTPVVMVSISDPSMRYNSAPFQSKENGIKEILRLSFADADKPGTDVYGHIADSSDLMQPEDGQKIKKLLDRHVDTDVIVHCDAGISRSAGVAAGILKGLTNDDSQIFDNPRYYPNRHCYRTTLQALWFTPEQQSDMNMEYGNDVEEYTL